MKYSLFIVVPALFLAILVYCEPVAAADAGATALQAPKAPAPSPSTPAIPAADLENARKARALLEQAITALGGQAYLQAHNLQEQGRTYSFYHGRSTSNGVVFWRFVEYPDKERIEVTQQRDVAVVYNGEKGYEITYKGAHEIEKKDLDDYLRHRRFSLETMLRSWINDPGVALFYQGEALAGNLTAQQVTLINQKDEAVSVYLDLDTHLPLKKSYSWRDAVDNERDTEEEIYDNYREVQGVMTPYGFTRFYNGDMQTQRFVNSAQYNQALDETMFDPNSGYNPNKLAGKHKK
jgi:hypothetical protein